LVAHHSSRRIWVPRAKWRSHHSLALGLLKTLELDRISFTMLYMILVLIHLHLATPCSHQESLAFILLSTRTAVKWQGLLHLLHQTLQPVERDLGCPKMSVMDCQMPANAMSLGKESGKRMHNSKMQIPRTCSI
jgi:hypothetical protein